MTIKKTPSWVYMNTRVFDTKGEAEKFAISFRAQKKKEGVKVRYEENMDATSGKFRIKVFYYATDAKGGLL